MLVERTEGKWIEVFARVFEMCAVNNITVRESFPKLTAVSEREPGRACT
jgi:hypothetical protein